MADMKSNRPLSPHLQIYKPMLTMTLSIVHRITGAALYFGTLLLCWWLIAAAAGPEQFAYVQGFLASFLGQVILFGYVWALIHHMFGGIRHLIWDTGHGFELPTAEAMAMMTIGGSVAATVLVWIVWFATTGGAS